MSQPLSSGLRSPSSSPSGARGWLLLALLSILLSLVTGLVLVWLSIERADAAFRIGQLQAELDRRVALKAKLEVERDKLLAPVELGRKAAALGMREARPGQIRRLTLPPVNSADNTNDNANKNVKEKR